MKTLKKTLKLFCTVLFLLPGVAQAASSATLPSTWSTTTPPISISTSTSTWAWAWEDAGDTGKFPSIAAIENYLDSLTGSGCTGVFVTPELVLTAGHCPAAYSRIKVGATQLNLLEKGAPFRIFDCHPGKVPTADEWQGYLVPIEAGKVFDYQILRVQWFHGRPRPQVRPAKIMVSQLPNLVGTEVELLGYPVERKGQLTLSRGHLVAVDYAWSLTPEHKVLAYTAPQGPQMSGGPLFLASSGQLIGIAHGSFRGALEEISTPDLEKKSYATSLNDIISSSTLLRKISAGEEIGDPPALRPPTDLWHFFYSEEAGDESEIKMSCEKK